MALGSLSYTEGREIATTFKTSGSNINDSLAELQKEMNSLESVLKSKGATELYETYVSLSTKLDTYPEKVIEFSNFLNAAINKYEEDDLKFQNKAS